MQKHLRGLGGKGKAAGSMVGDKEQDTYFNFTACTPPLARSTSKRQAKQQRAITYFLCYLKDYEYRIQNVLFFV